MSFVSIQPEAVTGNLHRIGESMCAQNGVATARATRSVRAIAGGVSARTSARSESCHLAGGPINAFLARPSGGPRPSAPQRPRCARCS